MAPIIEVSAGDTRDINPDKTPLAAEELRRLINTEGVDGYLAASNGKNYLNLSDDAAKEVEEALGDRANSVD